MTSPTYLKIVAKKARMCGRFGHVPPQPAVRQAMRALDVDAYRCKRCGATVSRETKREVLA